MINSAGFCYMKETDLFPPVKTYLEKHGYNVHAEVGNCDIVAAKDNETIILEMKLQLSVKLLCQAVIRQKLESAVYIVIPQKRISKRQDFKEIKYLLRRLEIGLITVDTSNTISPVNIIFHPQPYQKRSNKRKQVWIREEVEARGENHNIAGSSRIKIVTAYRKEVIYIATVLKICGPLKIKMLKELGGSKKTGSILNSDFYKWFRRVGHATYELTPAGHTGLERFEEISSGYETMIKAKLNELNYE